MAFNPFQIFRKRQKTLLAIVTIFIMFLFVLSTGRWPRDDLARRGGLEREEMRAAVRDAVTGRRRAAARLGVQRGEARERALARLGLVRREEHDDLALRVAQLEHRVRLLERER